jgi:hypothetical protein
MAARKAQEVADTQLAPTDDVSEVIEVVEEGAEIVLPKVVLANQIAIRSPFSSVDVAAHKRAMYNFLESRMTIPRSLSLHGDDAEGSQFYVFDRLVVDNLQKHLAVLLPKLDELDGAYVWPVAGDDLLWNAYNICNAFSIVNRRNQGLVEPKLLMQATTLRCCLKSLLQQKQQRKSSSIEIVEIEAEELAEEEMTETTQLPAIRTTPAACLNRSVSNATSVGTPAGATPMSAHGSMVPYFGAAKVLVKKSTFELNPDAKEFVPSKLNPWAKPFVPSKSGTPKKVEKATFKLNPWAKEFVHNRMNS